jgi:hypothetical protein
LFDELIGKEKKDDYMVFIYLKKQIDNKKKI